MRYRLHIGSFAWIMHRFSGIALTLYIFLHLYVLSSLKDPERFESLMRMFDNPFIKISEAGLLLLVIVHSLNGVRLTLLDLGVPTRLQKPFFWTAVLIGGAIFIAGTIPLIGGLR